MPYGTLKVDNITYTSGGSDASTSVSGIVALAAGNFNNVTATGTISGVTVTGVTANFQSGVFTTQISGATVAGPTHTGTTANFVSGVFTTRISGATLTGDSGQFTNITGGSAGFTSVTGATITGGVLNANSANFTSTVTGTTFTGSIVNANSANFTASVTGTTFTGATVNAVSANFTASVTGVTVTGTTASFASGNFTGTLSGATTRDSAGNVRDIPQNSQTTSYQLVASDAGKHVFTTAGVTVPSGVFAVGQAVTIYNNTTGTLTITQGTNVTLRQAGASGTGNRTLAQRGLATVLCVSGSAGTEFVIAGNIT